MDQQGTGSIAQPAVTPELTPAALFARTAANWRTGALGAALALIVAGGATIRHQPVYRSDTTIAFRKGTSVRAEGPPGEGPPRDLASELKDGLLSRANLTPILDELGLYPAQRARGGDSAAAEELRRHINFQARSATGFIISCDATSGAEAEAVTARLARSLVDRMTQRRIAAAGRDVAFFEAEKKATEEQLIRTEAELARFLVDHPEYGRTAPAQVAPAAGGTADPTLVAAERRLSLLKKERSELEAAHADPELVSAKQGAARELASAEEQLRAVLLRYTAQHPDSQAAALRVRVAETRLKKVEGELAAALRLRVDEASRAEAEVNARIQQSEREIAMLKRRSEEGGRAASPGEAAERAAVNEAGYARLRREVDEATSHRATLEAQLVVARRERDSEAAGYGSQIVVVDPAYRPAAPISALRGQIGAVGLLLSLLVGVAAAAARGLLDDRIFGLGDLRAEPVPVLVVIPRGLSQGVRAL